MKNQNVKYKPWVIDPRPDFSEASKHLAVFLDLLRYLRCSVCLKTWPLDFVSAVRFVKKQSWSPFCVHMTKVCVALFHFTDSLQLLIQSSGVELCFRILLILIKRKLQTCNSLFSEGNKQIPAHLLGQVKNLIFCCLFDLL